MPTHTDSPTEREFNLAGIDYALAVATLPFTLFVLMFATTGMTTLLESPRKRRTLGATLLALEVLSIGLLASAIAR